MSAYLTNIPGQNPFKIFGYPEFEDYYFDCEMQTKSWLLHNLTAESVFLDIGANVGVHTLTATRVIGENGMIIAVEPTNTREMLIRNLKLSSDNVNCKVKIVSKAVSNKDETRVDKIYKIWGQKPELEKWEFTTIDSIVNNEKCNRLDVIKIDVDGYELEALEGAQHIIKKFRPKVIVEINEALKTRGISADAIFKFFLDLRYTDVTLLDQENYAFSSDWQIGLPWPNSLRMTFWRKQIESQIQKDQKLSTHFEISDLRPKLINKLVKFQDYFRGKERAWSYLLLATCDLDLSTDPFVIEIEGTLTCGKISALVVNQTMDKKISNEPKVQDAGKFNLRVETPSWTGKLVLRTITDESFDFQLDSIKIFSAKTNYMIQKSLPIDINSFSSQEELFSTFLGVDNFTNYCLHSVDLPHHQGWLMEQSSSHFLLNLVKNLGIKNMLEIGTWEGFTAAIVLRNTDANIWTIDSESIIDLSKYGTRYGIEKSTGQLEIGWIYKTLNFENRVTQITSDSTTMDWSKIPDNHFDIIFVDGSHVEEDVFKDVQNCLSKLKRKGLMVLDDFNLSGEAISEAEEGVRSYINNNQNELKNLFELGHLKGTQFLLCLKI